MEAVLGAIRPAKLCASKVLSRSENFSAGGCSTISSESTSTGPANRTLESSDMVSSKEVDKSASGLTMRMWVNGLDALAVKEAGRFTGCLEEECVVAIMLVECRSVGLRPSFWRNGGGGASHPPSLDWTEATSGVTAESTDCQSCCWFSGAPPP